MYPWGKGKGGSARYPLARLHFRKSGVRTPGTENMRHRNALCGTGARREKEKEGKKGYEEGL